MILRRALHSALLFALLPSPFALVAQSPASTPLEALSGEYTNPNEPDTPLSFYVENGKLVYENARRLPVALQPISPTEFAIPNTKATLRFTLDASGRGASVVLSQGPDQSIFVSHRPTGAPRLPRLRAH